MTRREEIEKILKKEEVTIHKLTHIFNLEPTEIVEDLRHIARSNKLNFIMKPATCTKCGFIFKTRKKIRKPSKCPKCKEERISEPTFTIKKEENE